jgi:hypothetical protein
MLHYIKHTDEFGRGVYALHDLPAGLVLFEAELLVLSPSDTEAVNKTDLQFYTFKYSEAQDCLVLGDGELFNHDKAPNAAYALVYCPVRLRSFMQFVTLKPITKDEQIFIDYEADAQVDSSRYTKNLIK